jgi:hypothetical protein
MEQMNTDGLQVVRIDYSMADIPESVQETRPTLYQKGDQYHCVLGPDEARGIVGHGATLKEALIDFDHHFKIRLGKPDRNDPVSEFIQHRHV